MNKSTLAKACHVIGIPVLVSDHEIKEEKKQYENYSLLEKKGTDWQYAEVNFERRTTPEKGNVKLFQNDQEAIRYFFINVLKNCYTKLLYPPNNPVHEIKTIDQLRNFFQQDLGVPDEYYSFETPKPQAIIGELVNNDCIISYMDTNRQKRFSTMPLSVDRGLFVMYRLTYSLYLLKNAENELLDSGLLVERFSDEEIEMFIK